MFDGTLMFAGGTTGGHLFPGLAVAEEWRRRHPRARILFVGSGSPLERQVFDSPTVAGILDGSHSLPVASTNVLRRNPLRFLLQNARSLLAARRLIARENPIGVLGLGGFASFPLVRVAQQRGVPTLLLEQNAIAGRATRWLCRRADALCLSYEPTLRLPHSRANKVLTGNPLRSKMGMRGGVSRRNPSRLLLILGGSQGARGLNDLVIRVASHLRQQLAGWRILHQTGTDDLEKVSSAYRQLGIDADVVTFVDDLAPHYLEAELAISRAGATTLAELACFGIPTILVPYPHSADGHQKENAARFVAAGGAGLVPQDSPPPFREIHDMLIDPPRRERMSQGMLSLARPQATAAVVDVLENVLSKAVRKNR